MILGIAQSSLDCDRGFGSRGPGRMLRAGRTLGPGRTRRGSEPRGVAGGPGLGPAPHVRVGERPVAPPPPTYPRPDGPRPPMGGQGPRAERRPRLRSGRGVATGPGCPLACHCRCCPAARAEAGGPPSPGVCLKGRALWGQTQGGYKAVGARCKIGWGAVTGGWNRVGVVLGLRMCLRVELKEEPGGGGGAPFKQSPARPPPCHSGRRARSFRSIMRISGRPSPTTIISS